MKLLLLFNDMSVLKASVPASGKCDKFVLLLDLEIKQHRIHVLLSLYLNNMKKMPHILAFINSLKRELEVIDRILPSSLGV